MILRGSFNNHQASFFVDNGANTSYMDEAFAKKMRLKTTMSSTPFTVQLANGTLVECSKIASQALLKIGDYVGHHNFIVCPGLQFEVFLGLDWLSSNVVLANYAKRVLYVPAKDRTFRLKCHTGTPESAHNVPMISQLQFKRAVRKNNEAFMCFVRAVDDNGNPTKGGSPDASPTHREDDPVFRKKMDTLLERFNSRFAKTPPGGVPLDRGYAHKIDIEPGSKIPVSRMYRMGAEEMAELGRVIPELLEKGFIQPSVSPYGAPVLFVRKKDGSLRMCVDYRPLNNVTIKNKYPLPFIDDLLEKAQGCKYFTKIDLCQGYYQVKVAPEDTHKTAFRTRLGLFEWLVLPLGLTNAPATFMGMMNHIFRGQLDKFLVVYLDDLLIFSNSAEEHLEHVEAVLRILEEQQLFISRSKCTFGVQEVDFLGHVVNPSGISVDPRKVAAVADWPTPNSATAVRSFLGLANYYRRFIRSFSGIAAPLTDLTRSHVPFSWTDKHQSAFDQLKQALISAPVLRGPDPLRPFVLHTDASDYALGAVLMQDFGHGLQPIAYESHRFSQTESNWPTHERELFAVVFALKKWRHYVGMRDVSVYTDHAPLRYIFTQPNLSPKQTRWLSTLQEYKLDIQYKPGATNVVADALSRKIHLMSVSLTSLTISDDVLQGIISGYSKDKEWSSIYGVLSGSILEIPAGLKSRIKRFTLSERGLILLDNDRICVPNDIVLRLAIFSDLHDSPEAGHNGVEKTYELIHRYYYWKGMYGTVEKYIKHCEFCQRNKPSNVKPPGLLQSMPTPSKPWDSVSCDFIVKLPLTTSGFDSIAVFVDMFSKMAHFVPCTTDITAEQTAELFVNNIFRLHGLPANFISDRDSKFTSAFWKSVMEHFRVTLKMSSSYHPQTDGQTERVNRILEQMLRNYVTHEQNDWDKYLIFAEFAYNNAVHSSTGYSPFYLNYGAHPAGPHDMLRDAIPANRAVETFISKMDTLHKVAIDRLNEAKDRQTRYANERRSELLFKVGDRVRVHSDRFYHPDDRDRPSKKLGPVYSGPYEVIQVINPVAYKLKLPPTLKTHPVFHVSDLLPYNEPNENSRRSYKPPPDVVDGKEEFEVEKIVDHKLEKGITKYQVRFKGYPASYDLWYVAKDLQGCKELLTLYNDAHQSSKNVSAPAVPKPKRGRKKSTK